MNIVKEKYTSIEIITLIIQRKTLQVCNTSSNTQLAVGTDIFDFFKKFKPVFDEYPSFSGFLTQLKMYQRNGYKYDTLPIINTFHNNFNFYSRISNNVNIANYVKSFTVTLTISDNKHIDIIELSISGHGCPETLSIITDGTPPNLTHEQIKHEIVNSLNLINMSNILIKNKFKDPELAKFTSIINFELENIINILNNNYDTTENTNKTLITIQSFYKYIRNYLAYINTIYNIDADGVINIEPVAENELLYSYINVNPTWFKIILDNIFKNIYGHIGKSHTLLLKQFNIYFNKELNTLCIDITNKHALALTDNSNRCQLYKQITDKYYLSMPNSELCIMPIKKKNGQGLTLINILCEKQNIKWQLLENEENEYIFKLAIPVYNNLHKRACHLVNNEISNAKLSNQYINEPLRETII